MTKMTVVPMMALLAAALLPVGCADLAKTPTLPVLFKGMSGAMLQGGAVTVNVGIPSGFRTKAANSAAVAKTAADVARVKLYLYAKNASHGTYDYIGSGTNLFTSTGYTWLGGADTTNTDHKYTISNIPISATAYIVCARAYSDAGESVNITKTVAAFDYARSSNDVTIAAGTTTYSASTALNVDIPLLDAVGAPVDVNTTFTAGGAGAAISGADS
jgi:hypothetical protein